MKCFRLPHTGSTHKNLPAYMQWHSLYTARRIGDEPDTVGIRTDYQRDYDRLIFSSAFRRLQSKTQVFPLPGSTFVHNRLTHSLEVSSVGRSLGTMIGSYLIDSEPAFSVDDRLFYTRDLPSIIAAGCLAHDIGNPAFGHSGEDAIASYFEQEEQTLIDDRTLHSYFSEHEWIDLTSFEGNANALRILTQDWPGRAQGGMGLTITTLASILKYPCPSPLRDKRYKHRSKYSYFKSEQAIYNEIVQSTSMMADTNQAGVHCRHPYVYMVEAADDICYRIIDLEDAHRIGIVSRSQIEHYLIGVIRELADGSREVTKVQNRLSMLSDDDAAVSYLRAKAINAMVEGCVAVFQEEKQAIIAGEYRSTLVDDVAAKAPSLADIEDLSIDKIYNHPSVVEIEIAGYNVMSELLSLIVPAVLKTHRKGIDRKTLRLLPDIYRPREGQSAYERVMLVLDYISAMTDLYATELYRKIKGIEIPKH